MEYFIVANSFAAPFVSDRSESFEEAESPEEALRLFADRYSHPARLFAADIYASATDYHKNKSPLARWLCNREIERQRAMEPISGGRMYESCGPGHFKVNGELIVVDKPYEGKLVPVPESTKQEH